ncbi:ammonia channel protein [Comamonas serinivorans]|uniref:Ammonium transporter n=1 Tax=Comamonas serinivorans TaxID=1082851 RepID=A0A1Y0ER28_9BURK|nr:ammonium transporter [Comamonas serinivorans]ARU05851.1 ammonia channel protein [Comamonas serinivorans]
MDGVLFSAIDKADTAWMLVATALVLLMTLPGLALFYAGLVRRKNVVNTLCSVLAIACVVTLTWFALGYSLAFGGGSSWLGGLGRAGFAAFDYDLVREHLTVSPLAPHLPEALFAMFQLSFAILTTALVVGAVVERMRFGVLLVFAALWSVLVYAPVAHWVWAPTGWLHKMGALDFAGGAVVHVNAGVAALVVAALLGPRRGFGQEPFEPHSLGWTAMGGALLVIGWFGFNAGSALTADGRAALALLVTLVAAAAGGLAWLLVEWLVRGAPTLLGLVSGMVGGLVAVTPAAGFVQVSGGLWIGLVAGVVCFWGATWLKRLLGVDDSLDVFGVHGVGGLVGSLLTACFAVPAISGQAASLLNQAIAVLAVAGYSAVATALIMLGIRLVTRWRVAPEVEAHGLDLGVHLERQH